VLLYDLRNKKTNPDSKKRTLQTTDELYISTPYFRDEEARRIKSAIAMMPPPRKTDVEEQEGEAGPEERGEQGTESTIKEAIKTCLANFFEKRRESGDSRPYRPHDMAPIYERVFGVEKSELEDERFLRRLRRSGLGESYCRSRCHQDKRCRKCPSSLVRRR
jgi:hypothetical protein